MVHHCKTKGKKMSKKNNTNKTTKTVATGADEKITISRAELHMYASAYGNKVQAYEAGFAIDLFIDLLKGNITMKDVAFGLVERSIRHNACAMLLAGDIPHPLREMVKNYCSYDKDELMELIRLVQNSNK